MDSEPKMKVVGRIKTPQTPEECFRRADVLEREMDKLNPYPRPRGFVFKAKTYADYERWRREQKNPRSW
jgi:hypothetical protein